MNNEALPPLPESMNIVDIIHDTRKARLLFDDQLEAYANAAIAPYKSEIERLKALLQASMPSVARIAELQKAEAERDKLRALLREAREVLFRAGSAKLNDGTYFDKDCAVSLLLPRIDAALGEKP